MVQIADNIPLDRLADAELAALRRPAERRRIDVEVGTCGIVPADLGSRLRLARFFGAPIVRVVLACETIYRLHPRGGLHRSGGGRRRKPAPAEVLQHARFVAAEYVASGRHLAAAEIEAAVAGRPDYGNGWAYGVRSWLEPRRQAPRSAGHWPPLT